MKTKPSKLTHYIKTIGPGLITGASDDDPSGIATYSQAGAQFGLTTLWTALFTFPLMAAIQEMCARIGLVTSHGLITNIKQYYPKPLVYLIVLMMFPAIILNIGADISGMGAVANLLFPSIPAFIFSILFTFLLLLMIIKLPYLKVANALKYLCLTLLLYIIVPFLIEKEWMPIIRNIFIPHIEFNKKFATILVAILGTTISPYLFFWQATMEAEEKRHKNIIVNNQTINEMIVDVDVGMIFSNVIMFFIMLTTGVVLYTQGAHEEIRTVQEAALALAPVAGRLCYLFFALGVISTGLLAIPVLSGALSYIFTSTFQLEEGLDKKFYEAKSFYGVVFVSLILGLFIDLIHMDPLKVLLYAAIFYGLLAPILIFIILLLANNKNVMGQYTNGRWSNILGSIAFIFMSICAIAYLLL